MLLSQVIFVSCNGTLEEPVSISLKKNNVEAGEGKQFLTINATGDWTVTIVTGNATGDWSVDTGDHSGEVDWAWFTGWDSDEEFITITKEQAAGKPVSVYYAANRSKIERSCRIILTSGSRTASCVLTQERSAEEVITPETIVSDPVPMWLELPATAEGDGRYFISHEMKLGSVYFRNYSLYMSEKDIVAHWVAYPLNAWTISTGTGRTNEWGLDPKLPRKNQPVIFSTFENSRTYARGHQCPSADRYAKGANEQTFYGSNMTPQMHALNSYAWAVVEGVVRSKCRQFDTLYVVTGCYTGKSLGKCRDNDGKQITIPGGYYKALLGFKRGSKPSANAIGGGSGRYSGYYIGTAYYFEHREYDTDNSTINACRMSIDELEKKTGEDFFPNLVSILGADKAAEVEAANDSYWNL